MQYEKEEAKKQEGITRAYMEYSKRVRIFIQSGIRDERAVEDILQDVFMEALRKYDVFSVHPKQIGWLYRTARYKMQEYIRKNEYSQHMVVGSQDEHEELGAHENGYFACEFNQTLKEVLSEEELKRFKRFFVWGYSVEELAIREGVTVNNMRVRLTRLKQKILKEI
ncbi:MAG: sigma-70 family RNA polymerase sigma factor [Lachnospiraceae bacterium]|nr:sigma-70 family RNA polymerase sigma factor [Lachnospiraceae bacterium]